MSKNPPLAYDESTFLDERLEVLLGAPRRFAAPRPQWVRSLLGRAIRPGTRRG